MNPLCTRQHKRSAVFFVDRLLQLFGNWIKWLLLTVVTLGIYAFFVKIRLMQRKTKHTEFAD